MYRIPCRSDSSSSKSKWKKSSGIATKCGFVRALISDTESRSNSHDNKSGCVRVMSESVASMRSCLGGATSGTSVGRSKCTFPTFLHVSTICSPATFRFSRESSIKMLGPMGSRLISRSYENRPAPPDRPLHTSEDSPHPKKSCAKLHGAPRLRPE